jgi:type VI secretion system protein VasJ
MNLELLGREPIRGEHPTGTDIRYDPAFEELQVEVSKFSSPSGISNVNWTIIIKLASEILAEKSKDLLVTSYLAVALIYNRQIEGFAIGLRVYQELLENFWDDLYPEKNRMRARSGAIEWWLEKTETALKRFQQTTLPSDQLTSLRENVEKINQFLSQHLEEPPSFSAIRDQLESFAAPAPPPEQPKQEGPATEKKAPREEPEISVALMSADDAQIVLNDGLQKILRVATFLWQGDLSNPQAYRWTRIAAWSMIDTLPQATDGQTRIFPPTGQIRNLLIDLRNKGNDESLLKSAEARVSEFIFWIDLNRFVSEALMNLGEAYQKAKDVVEQETAYFIHRLPGLEDLSFSDGFPFADPETKQWLKGITSTVGFAATEPLLISEPLSKEQNEDLIGKEISEAQILIKKGKLLEAIGGIQQKFQSSLSQKEKLLWRLGLCQLLLNTKQTKLILPYLEQVINDIDFFNLEEYDPKLALRGLKLVWAGLHSQSDQFSQKKADEILHRIAKIDWAEAIRMRKS